MSSSTPPAAGPACPRPGPRPLRRPRRRGCARRAWPRTGRRRRRGRAARRRRPRRGRRPRRSSVTARPPGAPSEGGAGALGHVAALAERRRRAARAGTPRRRGGRSSSNERSCLRSTYAASLSTASPRSWPCASLTALKRSRSHTTHADRLVGQRRLLGDLGEARRERRAVEQAGERVEDGRRSAAHLALIRNWANDGEARRRRTGPRSCRSGRRRTRRGRRRRSRPSSTHDGEGQPGPHAARREARRQGDQRQQHQRDRRALRPAAERDAGAEEQLGADDGGGDHVLRARAPSDPAAAARRSPGQLPRERDHRPPADPRDREDEGRPRASRT